MNDSNTTNQVVNEQNSQQIKTSDKELNFRALENKYRKELEQERNARLETERLLQESLNKRSVQDDDEESEPYVGHKNLERKLSAFEKKMEERIEKKAEERARMLLNKEKEDMWIRNNPDFFDVMEHAQKFAEKEPELAESILNMPEGIERQKLVYKNIKALGLHKPESKQSSIQDTINANKRSPYYQPSGIGTAPYSPVGDFSKDGQKKSYEKMMELKSRLRG